MLRSRAFMASTALAFLCAIPAVSAQVRTGQFGVRVKVQKDCHVVTTDVDFGIYRSDGPSAAQAPLVLKCSPGTKASIVLSGGLSGNPQARTMLSGASTLGYQLYRDAAHQDPINTTGPAFEAKPPHGGQPETFVVYGQIPAGQHVSAGIYVDTIQVTVQF